MVEGSSLIPLPYPYIVPGGRFDEIYYWDSYFSMLGLQVSGKIDVIESMLDNFSWLIENVGYIPSGNRTYYLGRSQPPFYALMVDLLAEEKGCEVFVKYLPSLEKEYAFWMSGRTELEGNDTEVAINHVVRLGDGDFLNRYFDQHHQPRIEMYATDLELAKKTNRAADDLFSDIRAACESGWDFSSRWLQHANDLTTIHTTEILPVDLNCLLYYLEITIAKAHSIQGNTSSYERFDYLAKKRKVLILKYFWNESTGYFHDYDFVKNDQTDALTLAGVFPLFFKLANNEQANNCAEIVKQCFLKAGGLVTSLTHSGQQWDAPNGWAPLQWIGVQGLRNYGFYELAYDSSKYWKQLNADIYHRTGKILEKYNVEDVKHVGGGGEYEVQDGFGWTNGVLLKLLSEK